MANPSPSHLQPVSIGIVAENKLPSSNLIEVTPIEKLPFVDGELTQTGTTLSASGTDVNGAAYSTQVASSTTIKAEWLREGESNRVSAPDVRRGARVKLYQFADSDRYYWTVCGDDSSLRKLETVTHAWSGTQDESAKLDPSNSYFFQVSTHTGLVTLTTSKANGEAHAYGIQLNTREGYLRIQDDIGNYLILDSTQNLFEIGNGDQSLLQMMQTRLSILTQDEIDIRTTNLNIEANTTHTGTLTENGALQLNGDMTTAPGAGSAGTGQVSIAANVNVKGNAQITGNTTTQKLTSVEDIDAPNVN
ncbi:hypothetical protein P3T23_009109 [Paraburkholderia sp. GAS448]|uniref:hypothetical protein n=1 Tax=Paraburkholderia sp. GAS448 TaxID=3035136 RepID=UPI003D1B42E7